MVNTATTIDGQTIIAIEGQETQEADEPPICGLKSPEITKKPNNHQPTSSTSSTTAVQSERKGSFLSPNDIKRDGLTRDPPTAGSSFVDGKSSDGNTLNNSIGTWDGSPGLAHLVDAADVAAQLEVDPRNGLTTEQAKARLERDGANQIDGAGTVSIGEILLRQVSNSLTIVLAIAMALSYGTMDFIEGAVITAVILLNIVLGFVQDFRAEKTMKSLLSLAAPTSQVVRNNGKVEVVKAETLVAGDIVRLTTGVVVPADLRIIESSNLEIEEALLTGESLPAAKHVEAIGLDDNGETALGDRTNMAYSATTVTKGRATGIVVATGMKTQVGNVAELLRGQSNVEESKNGFVRFLKKTGRGIKSILGLIGTPMQVKLSKFALFLFALAILLAIIVFSAAKWKLHNEVVLYGICVAVAVIPESLIAVMTITVAVGVKAMAAGNVVIRKMAALEAIGGVTNICSDKTGTLTQGKMIVHKVWIPAMGTLSISDASNILDPEDGTLALDGKPLDKFDVASQDTINLLRPVLDAVALNNVAHIERDEPAAGVMNEKLPEGEWKALGDPTEIALQVLAMRFGRGKPNLLATGNLENIMEHQFDSSLKRMSTVYRHNDSDFLEVFTKGASEAILPTVNISEKELDALYPVLDKMASEGLRVLCIASKTISTSEEARVTDRTFVESELKLHGLVGLYDPPRVETLGAVQKCHQAGIAVHMLTGDHLATASAIAEKVGILKRGGTSTQIVMKAQDFDKLSDAEIDALPSLPVVLARCSPTTKVRMVEALDRRRAFCVMTGDGVNDAPALKRAHVGIAMGINGTDVAKDAADMVLTDDNFASIVKAVEEGRRLFDNIQKFLMHLLISNISQVVLLLIALAFKDREGNSVFPLSPLEILWVNMVTSSFLALGLGMEEAQADIMIRPPRDLRVGVFTWELITDKMLYGVWAGILCLISFIIVTGGGKTANLGVDCNESWNGSCDVVFRARATVFAVLSFLLLVTAWEVKHFTRSLFNLDPSRFTGPFAIVKACVYNRFLMWAVVAGFVITFPVIYIPTVNTVVFKHKGITWEWAVVVGAFFAYVAFVEAWKACKRRFGIFASPPVVLIGESNV